jgi:hypothetical protein
MSAKSIPERMEKYSAGVNRRKKEQGRIVGMLLDPEGAARQFENLKRVLRKEAWEEGLEKGINKNKADVVRALLQEGMDESFILRVVKVTPEFLASIKDETQAKQT